MTSMVNRRKQLFKEQDGLCYYCAIPMFLPKTKHAARQPKGWHLMRMATVEHIVPLSMGGC